MTVSPSKIDSKQLKKALLRRSLSDALGKRYSLLYVDLITKPAPDDIKNLLVKLDVAECPTKTQ